MEKTTTDQFIFLIPQGRVNAIPREKLVKDCVALGIVKEKDADRSVRMLISNARVTTVIMNRCDGKGYYRPDPVDADELEKYIKQEESRAKSTFRNITLARKLSEDYKHGRITE